MFKIHTPLMLAALIPKLRLTISGKVKTLRPHHHIRIEMVTIDPIARPISDVNTAIQDGDDLKMEVRFL